MLRVVKTFKNLKYILNTVTFETIMQCTSLYTFWKGNETNNFVFASHFSRQLERIERNYLFDPKHFGQANKSSFLFVKKAKSNVKTLLLSDFCVEKKSLFRAQNIG